MKPHRRLSIAPENLRSLAEKLLHKTSREIAEKPVEDVQKLLHELQVHQVELEMQNDELRRTQLDLERSRDRYADLYNFAPVAYLTLNAQGRILEANPRAGELLGVVRSRLIQQEFSRFVRAEAQDTFYLFCRQVFSTGTRQCAELELVNALMKRLVVQVGAAGDPASPGKQACFACIDITKLKQAEESLRASEERFQLMTATIEDVLYSVDGVSREFQYVSPAFERLLGYTLADVAARGGREEFLGQVIQHGGFAAQQETFRKLQSHHPPAPARWEAWWRCKNGTLRCFEDCWIPLYHEDALAATYGVLREITERKLVEAALRESEQRYRSVFESSVDAIILAKLPSGRFTAGNPAALKMFGAKNEAELVLHGPIDLSPERQPDGRASARAARKMIAKAMREGSHFFEWTHRRITGEEFFADVLLTRMERDGKPAILGTVRDITARKRAEDALKTSERNLRILTRALEQSPASVVITNTTGEIEYVNPKFTEVTGYSLAEVLGKNPRLLKSGHQSREFYQELWTTITSGRDWRGEFCNRKKNGALFWESTVIAPIHDEHGTVTHFVALKEDITERRLLESELLEVADREQQRIGHDLHDGLGQRLTALEMKCFLLQEDLAADPHAARRPRLQQQAEHISQALRECITVTRAIAHGLAPVVLKREGLLGALAQLARRTHLPGKVECCLICDSPVAVEDFQTAKQLYRIAQEAVNNALKHARTRRIHIHLAHTKGLLRVQIKDYGRGLPSRRKKSGIGLEVMRHRAHAIGASLAIDSQPGQGVSVTCTLPIKNHEYQKTHASPD